MTNKVSLPIDNVLTQITDILRTQSNLLIKASPGSGKTTRVPPHLLKHFNGEILVLEPRRVAAKMAAYRVAEEAGESVGQTVGYHFRFEKKISSQTRLKFLTEGLMVRYILEDPNLSNVSAVILDEFHERHLHTDVAISMLRQLQKTKRPDLKIIVMSATLDLSNLETFLDAKKSVIVDAKLHPVKIDYLSRPLTQQLHIEVSRAVRRALQFPGDILVFLPGQKEIHACLRELQDLQTVNVLPLYGDLPIEKQIETLQFNPNRRRVILSTNIAESSLTVEGLSQIIDSGFHRQARFSSWSGNMVLETKKVSKSSSIQRAGRAGRLGPGICWRLYTESEFNSRLEFDRPELERADLASTALEIAALGWNLNANFPWFEPPNAGDWQASIKTLEGLGAIQNGLITELGNKISKTPCSPRFARVLIEAGNLGCVEAAAHLIAVISEGDVEDVDARDTLIKKRSFRAQKIYELLVNPYKVKGSSDDSKLVLCFMAGLYDRVAKVRKRSTDKIELTMAFGGAVEAYRNSSVWDESEYYLILEASEKKEKGLSVAIARSVYPVDETILLNHPKVNVFEGLYWNENQKRVEKKSGIKYGELLLMESQDKISEDDAIPVANILISEVIGLKNIDTNSTQEILNKLLHVINIDEVKSELARIEFAVKSGLKFKLETTGHNHWLRLGLKGINSLKDNQEIDWLEAWLSPLDWSQQSEIKKQLDIIAPKQIQLNKYRQVKINYEFDKLPWMESRLQDFFGLKEGPKINRGQTPIVIHLLAPNYRAVQVTQDLASFWQKHYASVKSQLQRDYPKHSWPDNPITAQPPERR